MRPSAPPTAPAKPPPKKKKRVLRDSSDENEDSDASDSDDQPIKSRAKPALPQIGGSKPQAAAKPSLPKVGATNRMSKKSAFDDSDDEDWAPVKTQVKKPTAKRMTIFDDDDD